jgi:cystathionine beta-lyase/cystathionine gamma-synthase
MSTTPPDPHPSTLCARAPGPAASSSRPLVPPLDLSVVYCPDDLAHVDALYDGTAQGFIYARDGHPNAAQLAAKLARLEGAEAGLICASGMGAIAAALLSLLGQGDRVLLSDGVYGRTSALVASQLPRWGIGHAIFDPADARAARLLVDRSTRAILVETISNPLLRVADLPGLAEVAREAGIPLIVDNTFAPLICRPIACGASLVMHSVTKMIGGHSDLTLGALAGDRPTIESIRALASTLGQTGNPFESWLAMRGLSTLTLRMGRASATALDLARRFEDHPAVARVYYPLLPSHPDFALANRLLGAGGGTILTVDLGARVSAETFIRALAGSIPFAPSLGDVQTTLSHPTTTSHRGHDAAALARQGITPGMVRISVGLEDREDLWSESRAALDGIGAARLSAREKSG